MLGQPRRRGLIVADVDHFKAINDSYGHATGDAVLREIGYRVRKNLRAFESAYRIGGEEFVVLLDESTGRTRSSVALRLRDAIRESPLGGVPTTVSFGLAASEAGRAVRLRRAVQPGRRGALRGEAGGRGQRVRGRGHDALRRVDRGAYRAGAAGPRKPAARTDERLIHRLRRACVAG